LQPIDLLNVIEPNPDSNRAYSKCYRALELYADSIRMRVVECSGAGDCLFLVFAFFMRFSILTSLAERRDLEVIVRGLLFDYASTPRVGSLLRMCLPTTSLTWPSRTYKNLARTTWTEY
jgi:hypothetical protein